MSSHTPFVQFTSLAECTHPSTDVYQVCKLTVSYFITEHARVWAHVTCTCTLYLGPVPEHPYCMCVDACTLAQYRPSTGTPILHVCGCMYLGPVPEHPYCMCVDASTLAQYRNTHTACMWMHVPWPSTGTPILHVWVHVPWPSTGTRHPASVPSRQCRHRLPAERLTPMAAVMQDEYKN